MRVVCPFTARRVQDQTMLALTRCWPGCEFVDVTGSYPGDMHAYSRLLAGLWRSGQDFALVEHDIVVTPSVFTGFEACRHEWCAHPYDMGGEARMWTGLGCTRFRGSLTRRLAGLADLWELVIWKALDRETFVALNDAGLPSPHHHWPMVEHVHIHGDPNLGPWDVPIAHPPIVMSRVV